MPFLEIGQLAACDLYHREVPGAGMIAGVGRVGSPGDDRLQRRDRKRRYHYPMTVKKHLRAQEIAEANRLPCIYLVDSGGANRAAPGGGVPGPRPFRPHLQPGADELKGIAQIACVMGMHRRRRYVPAMSDERHRPQSRHHLPAVPAGEGGNGRGNQCRGTGGGDLHARKSGVVDHLAENDEHALTIVRDIVSHLGGEVGAEVETREPRPPHYDVEELYSIIRDVRAPMTYEVIARIVDGSEFHEFAVVRLKPGMRLCPYLGHAGRDPRQQWRAVQRKRGEGRPFHRARLPAPHSLLFLQNISGFMVGGK
jgi:3-methylcrotonyl-CoA carboxylase beta subunit